MTKILAVLVLSTVAGCGSGTSHKSAALGSPSPSAAASSAEPTVAALALPTTSPTPSPSPRPRTTTASPKASPKPVATTTSPKPKATATKSSVPTAKVYANCTAMHVDYKGGVALPGAVNKGGATKYAPYYSTSLYTANKSKDRDKDGIACEA